MKPLSKLPPTSREQVSTLDPDNDSSSVNPLTLSLQLSSLRISPLTPPPVPPRRRTSNQHSGVREGHQIIRPSSPPPATTFPPFRRPSLSLPPSPRTIRTQRSSLPSLLSNRTAASSLRAPSPIRAASTPASPAFSRPPTPPSPPNIMRHHRRRRNRTPSPRPPLPRPAIVEAPPVATSRQKLEYIPNTRMRSR